MAKHDDKIKQLLSKIDSEKKSLGSKPKVSWNTNCIFRFDDNKHFNLNTISDPGYLVRALGFLLEKAGTQKEAAKRLGVENYVFDWKGYSLQDWEEDFKLKADIIAYNGKQKKLQALQKKLKDLRSEEAKTGDALSEIEALLT
jgi:hypothetical protein